MECCKGRVWQRVGEMAQGGARQGRALGRRGPTDGTRSIYQGCPAVGCRRGYGASATSSRLRGERQVGSAAVRAQHRRGCRASPRSSWVRGEREVVAATGRERSWRGCGASPRSSLLRGECDVGNVVARSAAVRAQESRTRLERGETAR
jgi:hypothetical protein